MTRSSSRSRAGLLSEGCSRSARKIQVLNGGTRRPAPTIDRCYVKSVAGGSLEPVTREGIYRDAIVSPERVDIASGHRRHVLTIDPSNRSSLLEVNEVKLADDEKHYVYSIWRTRTQLFTIEGLR